LLDSVAKVDLEVLLLPPRRGELDFGAVQLRTQSDRARARVVKMAGGKRARRVSAVTPRGGRPPNSDERGGTEDEAEDQGRYDENPRLHSVGFLLPAQNCGGVVPLCPVWRPDRRNCSKAPHGLLFTDPRRTPSAGQALRAFRASG
jgi:hypothetical protein